MKKLVSIILTALTLLSITISVGAYAVPMSHKIKNPKDKVFEYIVHESFGATSFSDMNNALYHI